MKIMVGCNSRATANKALTNFSPSPNHFEVKLDALILRNLALDSVATAFAFKAIDIFHEFCHSMFREF